MYYTSLIAFFRKGKRNSLFHLQSLKEGEGFLFHTIETIKMLKTKMKFIKKWSYQNKQTQQGKPTYIYFRIILNGIITYFFFPIYFSWYVVSLSNLGVNLASSGISLSESSPERKPFSSSKKNYVYKNHNNIILIKTKEGFVSNVNYVLAQCD